ncbi:PAS-domain containing protein [Methylobacterium sp. JK268]
MSYSIAALALLLLIPSLLVSALLAQRWVAAEQERLESRIVALDAHATDAVDAFLTGQIAMLQALSTSPALDMQDLRRFDAQARELFTLQGVIIILSHSGGQQVVNTRLPFGAGLPRTERPVDAAVLATGRPAVSDLFTGAVTGRPMVRVAVPVMRAGRPVASLSASYDPAVFGHLLAAAGIAAPYSGSLTDRTGTIIGRSDNGETTTGKPLPGFASIAGERGTWSGRNILGVPVFATYQRSALAGWTVSVGIERAALQAPLTRSLRVVLPALLGLMLVALAASATVGRRIVAAQRRLAAAAQGLGGRAVAAVAATPFREVNEVGAALAAAAERLHEQADALRAANRDLEERVAARTRELAAQRALLEATLDAMDQGLVVTDAAGLVAVWNRRAGELLGLVADGPSRHLSPAALPAEAPGDPARECVRPDGRVLEIRSTGLPDGSVVRTYTDVTARRRAEAALRDKTALLDATLAHMDQGVLVVDAEGIVQLCNGRALALLDLPARFSHERLPFADLVAHQERAGEFAGAAAGRDAWLKLRGDLLAAPKVYERARPDGTVLEVRTVRLAEGGAIRTFSDVTAHRQREQAIALSEARYRALAEALPQLVWTLRPDTREAIYRNAQFDRFYGPISNALGDRLAHNHPADRDRMAQAWARAEAAGLPLTVEGRLRRRDGAYRWHRLVMVPLTANGTVSEWLGTALDIDDIIAAKERIREANDLLQMAQNAAGAGVWEWDLRTGRMVLSRASALRLGLAPGPAETGAALPFVEWIARIHPEDAGRVAEVTGAAVAARGPYAIAFRAAEAAGDGAECWIESHGRVVCDETGAPLRVVGLDLDITPRMRTERALKEATRLAETARAAAEAASRAKSEFLAMISHEIRTPLHGILGYADLLLARGSLAPDEQRQVETIGRTGRALLRIVNDVLDLSAIEAGRVGLQPRPFALRGLVEEVAAIVREPATRKGLALAVTVDPALPDRLVGDPDRLRQVLLNLAANAQKFCHQGTIGVSVTRGADAAGGDVALRFAVSDTGIGIPESSLGRLFQRFSQADGSIRREFGGTGLGLAISKALVEAMGGRIGVESAPGSGSTFWFTLALPAADPAGRCAPDPLPPPSRPAARPARVLLADDGEINRDIARRMLEAAGHAVVAVETGEEAVRAVEAQPFDLVLMDVQMPQVDGLTATRRIRALASPARSLPIIAMTANVLPAQVAEFRAAGMDDHVGKPFGREALLAVVRRWTRDGEGGAGPADGTRPAAPAPGPTATEGEAA